MQGCNIFLIYQEIFKVTRIEVDEGKLAKMMEDVTPKMDSENDYSQSYQEEGLSEVDESSEYEEEKQN